MSLVNPNRHRWDGVVIFTWILAALTCAASVYIISQFGIVRPPVTSSYGAAVNQSQFNITIWTWCIGQSIVAILIAALFSMINSIYQNSCDAVSHLYPSTPPSNVAEIKANTAASIKGLLVERTPKNSPLDGRLPDGYYITRVNGTLVSNLEEANANTSVGKNTIIVTSPNGQESSMIVKAPSGLLGL